jgi:hypothetical protein
MPARVRPRQSAQGQQAAGAVAGMPAFQRAHAQAVVTGQRGERDLVLDMGPQDLPPPVRVHGRAYTALVDAGAPAGGRFRAR